MPNKIQAFIQRPAFYSLAHQFLMSGFGFALLMLLSRLLAQNELGSWLLFISAFSLADMAAHGILQTIIVKKINAGENAHHLATNAVLILLLLTLVITTGSLILYQFILPGSTSLQFFCRWYPWLALSTIPYNLCWWIHMGTRNFKRVLLQRLMLIVLSIVTLGISYLQVHHLTITQLVWSQLISYTLVSLFEWKIRRTFTIWLKAINKNTLLGLWKYGKVTLVTFLSSSLLRNADLFLIASFMNPASVAIYAMAQKLVELFEVLLRGIAVNALPLLHQLKLQPQKFMFWWSSRVTIITLTFVPVAIICTLAAPQLMQLLTGADKYQAAAVIIPIMALYVLILPADRLTGVALEALDKPAINLTKTLVILVVNISGDLIALSILHSLQAVAFVSILALLSGLIFTFSRVPFHYQFSVILTNRFTLVAEKKP